MFMSLLVHISNIKGCRCVQSKCVCVCVHGPPIEQNVRIQMDFFWRPDDILWSCQTLQHQVAIRTHPCWLALFGCCAEPSKIMSPVWIENNTSSQSASICESFIYKIFIHQMPFELPLPKTKDSFKQLWVVCELRHKNNCVIIILFPRFCCKLRLIRLLHNVCAPKSF